MVGHRIDTRKLLGVILRPISLGALFILNGYSVFSILTKDSVSVVPVVGQGSVYAPGNQSGSGFRQSVGMPIFFDR
jgi:hypothetical protein